MPPTHTSEGLDAAAEIRALAPEVGILLLSQYVEAHYALRLMHDFDGGVGYLLKDRVSDLAAFRSDLHQDRERATSSSTPSWSDGWSVGRASVTRSRPSASASWRSSP